MKRGDLFGRCAVAYRRRFGVAAGEPSRAVSVETFVARDNGRRGFDRFFELRTEERLLASYRVSKADALTFCFAPADPNAEITL